MSSYEAVKRKLVYQPKPLDRVRTDPRHHPGVLIPMSHGPAVSRFSGGPTLNGAARAGQPILPRTAASVQHAPGAVGADTLVFVNLARLRSRLLASVADCPGRPHTALDHMLLTMKDHVLTYLRTSRITSRERGSTVIGSIFPGTWTKAVLRMVGYLAEHFGQEIDLTSPALARLAVNATAAIERYLYLIEVQDVAQLTLRDWHNVACLVGRECRLAVPLTIQLRPGQF
jgi:hypothetical protein